MELIEMGYEKSGVLVVDLDGTLIKTDTLVESGLDFVHRNPLNLFRLPGWLMSGKAALKQQLASHSDLNFSGLPYNIEVLRLIDEARSQGGRIVLASACDIKIANGVAEYLGVFDDVFASDGVTNLSAANKRDALVARYGEQGFDYVGNSADDLLVWKAARNAILVETPKRVAEKAKAHGNVVLSLQSSASVLSPLLKSLRPHQWAKNMLIFVPLLAAHAFDYVSVVSAVLAAICFCFLASGTYLINDLLDIQDDRSHPSKRTRPFAAATLSPMAGLLASVGLIAAGIAIAFAMLPLLFVYSLFAYLVITLCYSLTIKSVMALDVITLTVLYTLRIVAGSLAISLAPTFWVLTFSLFIFLSLALVKRYAELYDARQKGRTEKSAGRGYYPSDLEVVSQMGVANGFMSILFFALYIQDANTIRLYSMPEALWLVCPVLLFWICRLWLITHRGQMHDDPVVFAIKDKVSLVSIALIGVVFLVAL